jgi:glucosamine--fructose-6-phosphate aminotransferase (isomerizing)
MCGIVGFVGEREAVSFLLPALRRLEYRGYDSAGVATLNGAGLELHRAVGKIAALESSLGSGEAQGALGIAHTRWATHGGPSVLNAHPHVDCDRRIAIVHNGIIENYRELRRELSAKGHRFRSETDSEVVAHLIEEFRNGDLVHALRLAVERLEGAYAIACIADGDPDTLVAVRRGGSPLIVGHGEREAYLASDIPALLGATTKITVLEESEIAVLRPGKIEVHEIHGLSVKQAPPQVVDWDGQTAEREGYPHFMLKEIFEQPAVVRATIGERLDVASGAVSLPELGLVDRELVGLARLCFVACGTSWHAGLVGRYLIERWARLPVEVDIASEFRYRDPFLDGRMLTVPISQSGETADTLAALREARTRGSRTVAICNVVGSSMAREADGVVFTRAGLEIGVASTKAFTAQLAALTLLGMRLGVARGFLAPEDGRAIGRALAAIPDLMGRVLEQSDRIRALAERYLETQNALFCGRGVSYPLALEGALKLKEISYVHAEGCAAGELKHGPIALIDPEMLVVAVAPTDSNHVKIASNVEEIRARGGRILAVTTEGDETFGERVDDVLPVPATLEPLQPLLLALPLQLFAYHAAALRGCDVDQPRNLAKSVTVE